MGQKIRVLIGTIPLQLIFGLIYVWGAISPFVQSESDWTTLQINLVFALTPLATIPSVLIGGRLADLYPPKKVLIGAMSLFTLGVAVTFVFFSPITFILGYSVIALGFGAGLSTPGSLAAVTRIFSRIPGTMAGLLMAIYGMSAMVVAPFFIFLTHYLNWIDSLQMICLLLAILGWIGVFILPDLPAQNATVNSNHTSFTAALKHQHLMINVTALVVSAPIGSLIFAEIGNFTSKLTDSPFLISLSVILMSIGNGLGRFFGGFIADRKGVVFTRNIVLVITIVSGFVFVLFSHLLTGLMFLALLLGFGFGGLAGILSPLAKHVIPESPNLGFGFLFGGFAFGSFVGPVLSSHFEITFLLPVFTIMIIVMIVLTKKKEHILTHTNHSGGNKYG